MSIASWHFHSDGLPDMHVQKWSFPFWYILCRDNLFSVLSSSCSLPYLFRKCGIHCVNTGRRPAIDVLFYAVFGCITTTRKHLKTSKNHFWGLLLWLFYLREELENPNNGLRPFIGGIPPNHKSQKISYPLRKIGQTCSWEDPARGRWFQSDLKKKDKYGSKRYEQNLEIVECRCRRRRRGRGKPRMVSTMHPGCRLEYQWACRGM